MQLFHFPSASMMDVDVKGFGVTDEGDEAVILTGDIALATDNLVALAAFLTGLGAIVSRHVAQEIGTEALLDELEDLTNGGPFETPPSPPLPFPGCPDVEGRDV